MKQSKQNKVAAKYTHSAWSGKRYERQQTHAELLAESRTALLNHPTIGRLIGGK